MLYYYIGACYFQDKQYENAIDYYKLAFDINDSYSYCNNIANSYYQLKNYEDALIWYRRSAERLYSTYTAKLNYEIMTNYTVYQNTVTNTVFISDALENSSNNSADDISFTNEISENTSLTQEIISDSTTDYILDAVNNTNYENNINKLNNTFTKLPLFTNVVITNTYTNDYIFTNTTVIFEANNNFNIEKILKKIKNNKRISDSNKKIISKKINSFSKIFTKIILENDTNKIKIYYLIYEPF